MGLGGAGRGGGNGGCEGWEGAWAAESALVAPTPGVDVCIFQFSDPFYQSHAGQRIWGPRSRRGTS